MSKAFLNRVGTQEYWCESKQCMVRYSPMMKFWYVANSSGIRECYPRLIDAVHFLKSMPVQMELPN
jgi:hypothetical protein